MGSGGVCGDDSLICTAEGSAIGAAVAAAAVLLAVWVAEARGRTLLASWLLATSAHKLVWGVPVIGDKFHSFGDLQTATTDFTWLYTRQIYVPVELGVLNMGLYCIIMPYPPTAYAAAAYWTASVWLAVQHWKDADAPLYTLHDIAGLFMGVAWFYAGFSAGRPPAAPAEAKPSDR